MMAMSAGVGRIRDAVEGSSSQLMFGHLFFDM
jgi:hypothetical protein